MRDSVMKWNWRDSERGGEEMQWGEKGQKGVRMCNDN